MKFVDFMGSHVWRRTDSSLLPLDLVSRRVMDDETGKRTRQGSETLDPVDIGTDE